MASIDPKVKARVMGAWATGKYTMGQLSEKYGVHKATISNWVGEANGRRKNPKIESDNPRFNRYMEALEKFGVAVMEMMTSQAELLSDPEYIRKRDTNEIIAHSRFISIGLERFIQLHRPISTAAGDVPALPEHSETVIPELVEE